MRRGLACLAVCVGLWLGAAAPDAIAAEPAPADGALAPECPPFESAPIVAPGPSDETGIAPSSGARPRGERFPSLPTASPTGAPGALPGEVLLALPKRADGSIAANFELAKGARVAGSFFSPVLCSTLVRVVGAGDPAALVQRAPTGSAIVRNDIYVTAADEIHPLAASGPDPYRNLEYALDQAGVDAARAVTDGTGARVALLDSAPDPTHRDLLGTTVLPIEGGPSAKAAPHGTMIDGVMRATEHNAFGIAGMAPGATVLAIPVCTPAGPGTSDECKLSDLLRGIDVAWQNGAQVVNMALVGPPNPLLRRAMDRLDQLGVLLVAAVGNEGVDEPRYPAAYPSVIGVGAVDRDGRIYPRGNRGEAVEVLAPGVEILSTVPGDSFAFGDGTSLAAANVTGMLALAVAASGNPLAARTAFFQAAEEQSDALPVREPKLCSVLSRLGKPCPAKPNP